MTPAAPPPKPPRKRLTRRGFLRLAALGVAGAATGGAWSFCTRSLTVERIRLPLPGLSGPLRIVQLSDTHYCTNAWRALHAGRRFVERAVDVTCREEPDLFVFTGDVASRSLGGTHAALEGIELLSRVSAPHGAFAVLGNHDLKFPRETLRSAFGDAGIRLLEDEWVEHRTPAGALAIAGIGFVRGVYAAIPDARAMTEGLPRLLLAHDPAAVYDLPPGGGGYHLILRAHTHGGQVVLPVVGAPWTETRAYPEYVRGLFALGPASYLYVNRGIGTVLVPARLGSRPEITVYDLEPPAGG